MLEFGVSGGGGQGVVFKVLGQGVQGFRGLPAPALVHVWKFGASTDLRAAETPNPEPSDVHEDSYPSSWHGKYTHDGGAYSLSCWY